MEQIRIDGMTLEQRVIALRSYLKTESKNWSKLDHVPDEKVGHHIARSRAFAMAWREVNQIIEDYGLKVK